MKRNGEVDEIARLVRKETPLQLMSRWDAQPGGHGRYLYGYGTTAEGPGMSIHPDIANRDLLVALRKSIHHFKELFKYCPHEISQIRTRAIVRLIFYMGYAQFVRQEDLIAAIFANKWDVVAFELRSSDWYDYHGQKARCLVREIRDDEYCDGKEMS